MNLPRSVSDVLAEHVTFEVECIDRMYLNVYVPNLQYPAGLVGYVHRQLGLPIASTAPLGKITNSFAAAVHRFARDQQVPWVDFTRGQRKDDVMHQHLAGFDAAGRTQGVVFIGRAQEKTTLFRTEKRHNAAGRPYPWIVKATGVVNHFYFYCVDGDFGPFFIKFCSYFPYNARLCLNGNHWAQRQAAKAGIGFTPMDNAFADVDDPAALQAICDRLGPDQIDALLRKWLAILPHPFSPTDRAAGYRYDLSILQAEFSLTQMLDRPVSGRVFFEQVIRDNLDLGRPDQVALIFGKRIHRGPKRCTPGRFRTRVITAEVTPSLHVDYKSTTIKQYHKQGRALRTETTINNTRDFTIGKRLTNLPALREVGFTANRRLLGVQRLDHDPITGTTALAAITDPVTTPTGTASPGCAWDSHAPTPCSPHWSLSASNPTGSPTRTCEPSPPGSAASTRMPSHPARCPTTYADYACTALSNPSRTPTATESPTPAYTPRCSSPASTTDSYQPACPTSTTPPTPAHCTEPPSPTSTPSTHHHRPERPRRLNPTPPTRT